MASLDDWQLREPAPPPARDFSGMVRKPSYLDFDKSDYPWKPDIDYRAHAELYRVGRGEQGVLICQPYRDEFVPLWRFKSEDDARKSSQAIWVKFQDYMEKGDFVGADMARKFLQMGFTRARRYANYKGGRKHAEADHHQLERGTGDPEKARSAAIFYARWKEAEADETYAAAKKAWKAKHG